MKIITNNGIYVQVKDLKYLSNLTGFPYFSKAIKVSGDNSNEFVLITNEKAISIIENVNEIVDFNEIYQMDLSTLSEYILSYSRSSLYGNGGATNYYIDGLRDILSFKKGDDLGYKIPLVKENVVYDDGKTVINKSTICDMYYVSGDVTDLKDVLLSMFEGVESLDYDILNINDNTIIKIKNIKEKKKSFLTKLRNKKEGK